MKLHKTFITTILLLIVVCLCIGLTANTDHHTEIVTEQVKPTDTEQTHYVSMGEYLITAYCPCEKCCGEYGAYRPVDDYGNQIVYTASGAEAMQGVTIAADSDIPFGTTLYIDGYPYIVQDRGGAIKGNRIDIYFDRHQDALNYGVQVKEVYAEMAREME